MNELFDFYAAYDAVLDSWPVDVTALELQTPFGTTRVNASGPDDGPPLVLLAGGGATSTVWFANVGGLSREHRVFAVDIVGDAGRSVGAASSVDELMAWFGGVLNALQLHAPAVAAHSYGAMVALAYALRNPDRISKLVLLDPNSCFVGMAPAYLLRAVPLLIRPTGGRQRRLIDWETRGTKLDERWLTVASRGAALFPSSKLIVPKRPDVDELRTLAVDTTVVLAQHSRVHDTRKVAESIEAKYPRLQIVTVPGSHHGLPMVPADDVNARILDAVGN